MEVSEDIANKKVPVRCQRIGCDAMFTDDNNPEGSCQYHPSPFFHDGMKEWRCCKQRSHDFSLFLAIPGCKTGKHTAEKPVTKVTPTLQRVAPTNALNTERNPTDNKDAAITCSRCRQGFFCSDHGSQAQPSKPATLAATLEKTNSPLTRRKIDLNEPKTCRNRGCGKSFKEKDNHDTACDYHPGPPVFHDRKRGWKCCEVYVNEFDEFMSIAPCTKGWHNAEAT
ncbi:unnamed protein product [Spirodela intermedia]|uniref:CHORD domain-containing protein n=2 Tax=Spirodela intermedia TaxID=51605 RepID=A0A7I8K4N9_SPIIN|nr:unnamed protein product [Spirodela intermedia]CAA6656407.1 unnamed protein product [Spirodela intermedia]CAA7391973.1 unnamed protein product [Spirodela intermedia]